MCGPFGRGTVEQCGWLRHRYGVHWQNVPAVLPRLLADPDPMKARRLMTVMLQMVKVDFAGLEVAYEDRTGR